MVPEGPILAVENLVKPFQNVLPRSPLEVSVIQKRLTRAGYRAVTAATGNDALRRFYDDRPDLVILDVALPGLDGWQVIERIREFSRIPIILVTARSSEADKSRPQIDAAGVRHAGGQSFYLRCRLDDAKTIP